MKYLFTGHNETQHFDRTNAVSFLFLFFDNCVFFAGERPFVCHICQKAFNQKNALSVHLKKHSGDKPHVCGYCNAAFTQRGNLKTHIKRAHHNDMLNEMNRPKGHPAMVAVNSSGVQPGVAGTAGTGAGGEPGVTAGVEGDLYLNDVADLL